MRICLYPSQASSADWAKAYAAAMRDVDPSAVHAVNRIEGQYQSRFGVNLREAHDLWREQSSTLRAEHVRLAGEGVPGRVG